MKLAGEWGGHHVYLRHLPYFVRHAPNDELPALIASWRGLELQPAKPETPEQKLEALEEAMERLMGPTLRAAIVAEARKLRR